jgi:hypothetical protein
MKVLHKLTTRKVLKARFSRLFRLTMQVGDDCTDAALLVFLAVDLGTTLNSAMRLCARVQIPVPQSQHSSFSTSSWAACVLGFWWFPLLRIACVFLHWERGRSSKCGVVTESFVYLFGYLRACVCIQASTARRAARKFVGNA